MAVINAMTEVAVYVTGDDAELNDMPAYEGPLGEAWRRLEVGQYSTTFVEVDDDDVVVLDAIIEFFVYREHFVNYKTNARTTTGSVRIVSVHVG